MLLLFYCLSVIEMQNSKITCKLSFFINNSFSILVSSSVKASLALFSSKLYHFLNLTSFSKSLGVSISNCKVGMVISLILIRLLWRDHGGYWMTFSGYLSSPYFLSFLQRACIYLNYNKKFTKWKQKDTPWVLFSCHFCDYFYTK